MGANWAWAGIRSVDWPWGATPLHDLTTSSIPWTQFQGSIDASVVMQIGHHMYHIQSIHYTDLSADRVWVFVGYGVTTPGKFRFSRGCFELWMGVALALLRRQAKTAANCIASVIHGRFLLTEVLHPGTC
mmetsp:Transcript_6687/g.12021  ORF Transcript_6687/g.12021 Transcript_6687/m.12021 type:complete len:130 (-) Transcript_6687:628-1017(-)